MKTLKCLLLLLAVTVALPTPAQEKVTLEKAKDKVTGDVLGETKAKDNTEITTGALSAYSTYKVVIDKVGSLRAIVTTKNGTELELVKTLSGSVQKHCRAKTKAVCPNGFVYEGEIPEVDPEPIIYR